MLLLLMLPRFNFTSGVILILMLHGFNMYSIHNEPPLHSVLYIIILIIFFLGRHHDHLDHRLNMTHNGHLQDTRTTTVVYNCLSFTTAPSLSFLHSYMIFVIFSIDEILDCHAHSRCKLMH